MMAFETLVDSFSKIEDPRVDRTKKHALTDILVLSVLAVMCNAEGWEDIEQYGKTKLKWLRTIIPLKNGVPSHDTISRVFRMLEPGVFQAAFLEWARGVSQSLGLKHVAIDGKSLRRSHDRKAGKAMLHSVMAWSSENHAFLGQQAVDQKSNEITAIPKLLELLALRGALITLDAMGCQTEIATKIIKEHGHFIMAVKDNHPKLAEMLFEQFILYHDGDVPCLPGSRHQSDKQVRQHGRVEKRDYYQLELSEELKSQFPQWSGLKSIIQVISSQELPDGTKSTTEVRYYISSLALGIRRVAKSLRQHWTIESMHWVLDMTFREDESRIRKDHGAENFALLRRFVLQLLKQDTTSKHSMRKKRKLSGWDNSFLLNLLQAIT